MTLPELVIDIREEHELLGSRLVSHDGAYEIINIPSRHIFANVDWITKQTEKRPVWLICASGRRSTAVKEQYFGRNDGIKSSDNGLKIGSGGVSLDPSHITVQKGKGGFGIQQIMQMAFAFMLAVIMTAIFVGLRREYLMLLCGVMLAAVVGQLATKSCVLGKVIPKFTFTPA